MKLYTEKQTRKQNSKITTLEEEKKSKEEVE